MINNIIEDKNYKNLVSSQIEQTILFLLQKNEEFAITVNIKGANFTPALPESIYEKLAKFSLFVLSNYTYSTVKLENGMLCFEAGFGAENFGSVVSVPLHCIFQIVLDESILFVNPVATVEKFNDNKFLKDRSKNIFQNNPSNKKFMK
jgi:hypothetical protein